MNNDNKNKPHDDFSGFHSDSSKSVWDDFASDIKKVNGSSESAGQNSAHQQRRSVGSQGQRPIQHDQQRSNPRFQASDSEHQQRRSVGPQGQRPIQHDQQRSNPRFQASDSEHQQRRSVGPQGQRPIQHDQQRSNPRFQASDSEHQQRRSVGPQGQRPIQHDQQRSNPRFQASDSEHQQRRSVGPQGQRPIQHDQQRSNPRFSDAEHSQVSEPHRRPASGSSTKNPSRRPAENYSAPGRRNSSFEKDAYRNAGQSIHNSRQYHTDGAASHMQNPPYGDDINVTSLADLGFDDDREISELSNSSSKAAVSDHTYPDDDLDLGIFDELESIEGVDTSHSEDNWLSFTTALENASIAAGVSHNFDASSDEQDVIDDITGFKKRTRAIPALGDSDADTRTHSDDSNEIFNYNGYEISTSPELAQYITEQNSLENGGKRKRSPEDIRKKKKVMNKKKKKRRRRKRKSIGARILLFIILLIILALISGVVYAGSIVLTSPEIDTTNIYDQLNQTSTIYDDEGELLEYVDANESRTIVSYDEMPQNLINAFVAIEDKTFFDHHGFNYIRILGAIKDSLVSNKSISGTSTITQQLARNIYLSSERSMTRKIREAYYTVILEQNLTKEQIIEAYLNTISLGYGSYGVEAAAKAYFGCSVSELTLAECATLASIPKSPSAYAPLKNYPNDEVAADDENIVLVGDTYTTVYSDAFKDRQQTVLHSMYELGFITSDEYDEAMAEDIRNDINPSQKQTVVSSYFADYCIDEVKADLAEEYGLSEADAAAMINKGLHIYSTLNVDMQQTAEEIYNKNSYFPGLSYRTKGGNIVSSSGKLLLYSKTNIFGDDDIFNLSEDDYEFDAAGNLKIYAGNYLRFLNITTSDGSSDIQIEFKKMYYKEGGTLYSINGGVINGIDAAYKSKDSDGNLIISAEYMNSPNCIFTFDDNGIAITADHYTLRQPTIQPQGAFVLTDFTNGQIKVMVGGRSLSGKLLYNRATNPRQPGSSIKPIAVYGPAIQSGVDYNTGWTAGSTIEDSENKTADGKIWPKNSPNKYEGFITLRYCVEHSKNVPSVRLITKLNNQMANERDPDTKEKFGDFGYTIKMLKENGITSIVEEGSSNDLNAAALALGGMTNGISPIEMASAYGTFPNGGVHVESTTYTKVTDSSGNVILESDPKETQVYDEGVAFIMTDILRTTVTNGIAGRAAIGILPVGGKTGTTTSNNDAWFVGFTPQYSAAVWIGTDDNIKLTQGSSAAASLWSTVMRKIASNGETKKFRSAPSNVTKSNGDYIVKGTKATKNSFGGKISAKYDSQNISEEDEIDNAENTDEPTTNTNGSQGTNSNGNQGTNSNGGTNGSQGTNSNGGTNGSQGTNSNGGTNGSQGTNSNGGTHGSQGTNSNGGAVVDD